VQTADMSGHCGCEFVLTRAKNVDNDRSDLEKPLQRRSGVHIGRYSVPERTMRRIVINEHHHQLSLLSAAAPTPSSSSSPATGTPSGGHGLPSYARSRWTVRQASLCCLGGCVGGGTWIDMQSWRVHVADPL